MKKIFIVVGLIIILSLMFLLSCDWNPFDPDEDNKIRNYTPVPAHTYPSFSSFLKGKNIKNTLKNNKSVPDLFLNLNGIKVTNQITQEGKDLGTCMAHATAYAYTFSAKENGQFQEQFDPRWLVDAFTGASNNFQEIPPEHSNFSNLSYVKFNNLFELMERNGNFTIPYNKDANIGLNNINLKYCDTITNYTKRHRNKNGVRHNGLDRISIKLAQQYQNYNHDIYQSTPLKEINNGQKIINKMYQILSWGRPIIAVVPFISNSSLASSLDTELLEENLNWGDMGMGSHAITIIGWNNDYVSKITKKHYKGFYFINSAGNKWGINVEENTTQPGIGFISTKFLKKIWNYEENMEGSFSDQMFLINSDYKYKPVNIITKVNNKSNDPFNNQTFKINQENLSNDYIKIGFYQGKDTSNSKFIVENKDGETLTTINNTNIKTRQRFANNSTGPANIAQIPVDKLENGENIVNYYVEGKKKIVLF